jgi:hypothetical protein
MQDEIVIWDPLYFLVEHFPLTESECNFQSIIYFAEHYEAI